MAFGIMQMPQNNPQQRLRWYLFRCESTRAISQKVEEVKHLGIPTLVPMAYRMEKRGKWWEPVEDGYLFPPYVFIAMRAPGSWKSRSSLLWSQLTEIRGIHVMGYRNAAGDFCPEPIPYKEMRKLRNRNRPARKRKLEPKFATGQAVRLTDGPFTGFDGIVQKNANERVAVLLSLFGRATTVELAEQEVRAA